MTKRIVVLGLLDVVLWGSALAKTMGSALSDSAWGQLERASDQTLNTGFKLNHLCTNKVLFNFTYIA